MDLDISTLPKHVAIIMDGNGRWAKKRLLNRIKGHREGAKSVDVIVRKARELGISYVTLYAFSTENWNRPAEEVNALMKLLREFLKKERKTMLENGIRLNLIGEINMLPEDLREYAMGIKRETEAQDWKMTLTLALSYGSRLEMTNAVRAIAEKVKSGEIDPADIDENLISGYLYTSDMPDPDLMIRTSGEARVSNYLLWQSAYTEFYFTETLWPEFREKEFEDALRSYASRERRFGKTTEQLKESK